VIVTDVNILIYAHRKDDPAHDFYRAWFERLLSGEAPFALSLLAAVGFVRIVTQQRFGNPTPRETAFSVVASLMELPSCRVIGPTERHWQVLRGLCDATKTSGSQISDAQHAAIAIEHGCTLVSRDPDFNRFSAHGLDFELLEP
jgi:toxin-antitoxin system PIN domain toxin